MKPSEVAMSYFGACGTSCSIAVGLNQLLIRKGGLLSPGIRSVLSRVVPFTGISHLSYR